MKGRMTYGVSCAETGCDAAEYFDSEYGPSDAGWRKLLTDLRWRCPKHVPKQPRHAATEVG